MDIYRHLGIVFAVLLLWLFHAQYLFHLFENAHFFSHLSDSEREMTYRTEMGLYFSFYKTLISSNTFTDGIIKLLNDNITEYGHTINTLQRFNLYPEVVVALSYRIYKYCANYFQLKDQVCWSVNRGVGLPPVESCEGVGNYHYFYVYAVFAVAGSVLPSLFLCGYLLGGYYGGILTTLAFLFNHANGQGEATRVQWTPPLRESFAFPMFVAQLVLLTHMLKRGTVSCTASIVFIMLTVSFCTFWQLSQFIIGIQLGILLILYSLGFIRYSLLSSFWRFFSVSFLLALLLLFGNSMLFSSLFFTSLLSIQLIFYFDSLLRISFRPFLVLVHIVLFATGTLGLKLLFHRIFHLTADNHIGDLLLAKFTNVHTFHTRLYTCAAEFDFMGFELFLTWLLPVAAFSTLLLLVFLFKMEIINGKWKYIAENTSATKDFTECLYHLIQLCCFVPMALLVMRLKLFATPQICLFCSLSMNKDLLTALFGSRIASLRIFWAVLLAAGMVTQGWPNVREQLSIQGEYSNPEQEKLFIWIEENTPKDAVFAGTMALMANVKLATFRPIFNHPHYESEGIRNRTLLVYSFYSRKPLEEVYKSLASMGVQFYIFQPQQCLDSHPRVECSYLAMWDEQDPQNRQRPSLCHRIWEGSQKGNPQRIAPFQTVYRSTSYIVLALQ